MADEPPTLKSTVIRSGLTLVPVVGGLMQVLFDDINAHRRYLAEQTAGEVAGAVGGPEALRAALEDPALEDLFVSGIEGAMRTRLEAKRRAFGRIVSSAILGDASVDESVLMAYALRDLEEPHLRWLVKFGEAQKAATAELQPSGEDTDDQDRLVELFRRVRAVGATAPPAVNEGLARTGLVVEQGRSWGGGTSVAQVTEFGWAFLEHLKRRDDETEEDFWARP